jgi:hypothetical protein
MKATAALSTALLVSACNPSGGNFCAVYQPLGLNREAATALVTLDRPAAEAAVVNEETYAECK